VSDRVLWITGAVLSALWGTPLFLMGVAPFIGGLDYNPEFDAFATPMGLIGIYGFLYCLHRAVPRMPWIGTPSFAQGCLFSWLGFAAAGIAFETLGALRGNRPFQPIGMAIFWGVILLPLGVAWAIQRVVALIRKDHARAAQQ